MADMGILISPSVLAADLCCLGDEIARAEAGGCDSFHIDIMDHHFVPNLSFGPNIVSAVRRLTTLPLEVHLMVDNPRAMLDAFADAGSSSITVHVEAVPDIPAFFDLVEARGMRTGVSFRPDTSPESVFPYLDRADIVLVMSVYPGFGGQKFMSEAYARVARVAEEVNRIGTAVEITVDGGVDRTNAGGLARAGATCLVAGTSVFRDHGATENVHILRRSISECG